MEGINFLRFLLLKDRETNYTNVWNKSYLAETNTNYIIPLENEAKKILELRNIEKYETEEQARSDYEKTLQKLHEFGLPDIS